MIHILYLGKLSYSCTMILPCSWAPCGSLYTTYEHESYYDINVSLIYKVFVLDIYFDCGVKEEGYFFIKM